MSYPAQFDVQIADGGLALGAEPAEVPLVIGCSSAGMVATLYDFTSASADDQTSGVKATLGYGALTEVGMPVLKVAGRALFLKLTGSVAAANSAVTATRIGTSVGTITLSGSATRDFRGTVEIRETTSALGSGKFRFSLDNRNTWSEDITIPSGGTYLMPNSGITLTFALQSGTPDYEDGDLHTFTCTQAHWNTTNLSDGITALLASALLIGKKIRKVYFTGIPADAATAATNAAAIATHMATLEGLDHFARAIMDCGSLASTSSVLSDFVAAFSDTRVAPCYGRCEMSSALPTVGFGLPFVSIMQPVAVRASEAEISENLGRVASGPLRSVKTTTLSHDEGRSTAFSASNRIITLMTRRNKTGGAYITSGFLKGAVGSDYIFWDYGVIVDEMSTQMVMAADNWVNSKLRALTDGTGNLHPVDALRVQLSLTGPVKSKLDRPTKDGLPSHASGWQIIVPTDFDFLTLRELRMTGRIVPTVPVEGGTIVIGLTRQLEAA
jgi:hypothetical protein